MLDSSLYKSIENATKVSDKRKSAFERLGVKSIYDLVTYYPYRYVDMSNPVKISHAQIGQKQSLIGRINKAEVKEPKPKMRLLEVSIVDDSGIIIATWFNQPWLDRMITAGATIAIFGMVKFDYGYKRITPEHFEVFDADSGVDAYKGVIPVYRANSDISNKWIRSIISSELDSFANLDDNLPAFVREKYRLMSKKHALRYVHFAPSSDLCEQAKRRLAFEEALKLQIYLMNNSLQNSQMRSSIASSFPIFDTMVKALPFTLTDDQNAALAEIKADMCSSDYMKRLVLGDVGCGKTVLAALALALCCDSGKQCVVMAPTVLLVFQYREKLAELLNAAGISFACLTGSTSADERKQILAGLKSGKIHCVFGTHALLSENVEFKDLGLVVIDEQHRFGVEQREKLLRKNSSCDYLMLSATPIPRSLALCIYGDMQISFLKSRPNKDLKITCQIVDNNMKFKAFDKIRNEVDAGHQAFIVCPLVGIKKTNANVDMQNLILNGQSICDYRSAIDNCKYLQTQIFPEYRLALLHGQMKASEKEIVLDKFAKGEIDILVATTIIEEGIDVANATVMYVEDAKMFGLSQLHQLRGRLARGNCESFMFLQSSNLQNLDDNSMERLEFFAGCDDGFELSKFDLRQRHEGNILGLAQSGKSICKLLSTSDNVKMIECARECAQELIKRRKNGSDEDKRELETLFYEAQHLMI